jgi:predicted nucleic acid-binding protein
MQGNSDVSAAPLESIPSKSPVFLDANIFVYGLTKFSSECEKLLVRCAREEIFGITTLQVINDVTHKLMIIEASEKGFITKPNFRVLKEKPETIINLSQYWEQILRILNMNLVILDLKKERLFRANDLRSSYGLFTNDSLIVAAMSEYGISSLASFDGDFDRVSILTRYSPTDIKKQNMRFPIN